MTVKVIEEGKVRRSRHSKYAGLLKAMAESLKHDGPDGRLRAIEATEAWSQAKLRRMTTGIRFYYRAHRVPEYRLSILGCAVNGITFRWKRDIGKSRGAI